MNMSGSKLLLAGEGEEHHFKVTDKCFDALNTPGKDRQHDELQAIIDALDTVRADPFVSMNDFEKLRCAQLCGHETRERGVALIQRGVTPAKMYLCIRGRLSVFDFTEGMTEFESQKAGALAQLQSKQRESARTSKGDHRHFREREAAEVDEFNDEWEEKSGKLFGQVFRMVEMYEQGQLPAGTRAWGLGRGALLGSGALLPQQPANHAITVVCTPGSDESCAFLTLDRSSFSSIVELVKGGYAEKAQLLRTVKLTAGVSKLTIKMLAMQLQPLKIKPNTIIVHQGATPTHTYIICKGSVRVLRKFDCQKKADVSLEEKETKKSVVSKHTSHTLEDQYVEIGLLGPTQFFGAVSILELGRTNVMQAHLVSCRLMDVYAISRMDVGKISYEDRELMLLNARKEEAMIVKSDAKILEEYRLGRRWQKFRSSMLKDIVIERKLRKKDILGIFETGTSSGGSIRSHDKTDVLGEDVEMANHPFQMLGSVVLGFYK